MGCAHPGKGTECFCFLGFWGGKRFSIELHEDGHGLDGTQSRDRTVSRDSQSPCSSRSISDSMRSLLGVQAGRAGIGMGSTLRELIKDDLANSPTSPRVESILESWDIRGAKRPITDFYAVEATLGEGQYGVVQKWKVKRPGGGGRGVSTACLGQHAVAVKQIRWTSVWGGWMQNKGQEQLLRNELKMLLVLDNPFIVQFREWFEQPCTGIFFVMELCEGPSLQSVLEAHCGLSEERRRGSLARLRRHFREITYAVSYIHSFEPPLVHRDLKPDNVLLKWSDDPNSVAKLIDFGLASLQESGVEGIHQGTPVFMAPEQYLSATVDITQEMDIWALGVIYVWIISATELGSLQHPMLPAEDGRGFEVQWIHIYRAYREKRPWNRSLFGDQPASAAALCDRILEYDKTKRIHATEILEEPWVKCGDPAAAAAAELLSQGSIITNIVTYKLLGRFDKKVLALVADNIHDRQVILLRRAFQALDTNKSGKLSWGDFVEGFRSNDVDFPAEVADCLFGEMDREGTGEIAYHDWLAATIDPRILRSDTATGAAFRCINASGTGRISRFELECAAGPEEATEILADEEVVDVDGRVSFTGFRKLMQRLAERRSALMQPEAVALSPDLNRYSFAKGGSFAVSSAPCKNSGDDHAVITRRRSPRAKLRYRTFGPGDPVLETSWRARAAAFSPRRVRSKSDANWVGC